MLVKLEREQSVAGLDVGLYQGFGHRLPSQTVFQLHLQTLQTVSMKTEMKSSTLQLLLGNGGQKLGAFL